MRSLLSRPPRRKRNLTADDTTRGRCIFIRRAPLLKSHSQSTEDMYLDWEETTSSDVTRDSPERRHS